MADSKKRYERRRAEIDLLLRYAEQNADVEADETLAALRASQTRRLTPADDSRAIDILASTGETYAQALALADLFRRIAESTPRDDEEAPRHVEAVDRLAIAAQSTLTEKVFALCFPPIVDDEGKPTKALRMALMTTIDRVSARAGAADGDWTGDPWADDDLFREILAEWRPERRPGPKPKKNRWELLSAWWLAKYGEKIAWERFKKDWLEYARDAVDTTDD